MQVSLTNKGVFVLVVGGMTLLLFLLSDNGRTGYEANPDVVSLRTVFVTMVVAVEEAGGVIKSMHGLKSLSLHRKPVLLKLDRFGSVKTEEVVAEADLISNYAIVRRIKLLRPDFIVSRPTLLISALAQFIISFGASMSSLTPRLSNIFTKQHFSYS